MEVQAWGGEDRSCLELLGLRVSVVPPQTGTWAVEGRGLCGRDNAIEDQGNGPQAGVHLPLWRDQGERVGRGVWPGILLTRPPGAMGGSSCGLLSPPSLAEQTLHNPSLLHGGGRQGEA